MIINLLKENICFENVFISDIVLKSSSPLGKHFDQIARSEVIENIFSRMLLTCFEQLK